MSNNNHYPFYPYDSAASRELFDSASKYIKPGACYDNVFRLVFGPAAIISKHPSWLVAYGGVEAEGLEGLFAKHAFFLDAEVGVVIDPTLTRETGRPQRYIIAVTYNTKTHAKVCQEHQTADSWWNKAIRPHMQKLETWCLENGFALIG